MFPIPPHICQNNKFPLHISLWTTTAAKESQSISIQGLPVIVRGSEGGKSEAGVPVQFGLALGPLDGSFETFAEEALREEKRARGEA